MIALLLRTNYIKIAVSLNKNFPGDRMLLFQNILATFLVAVSVALL